MGLAYVERKTGEDKQENVEKEVGDTSPIIYYVLFQVYTVRPSDR